MLVIMQVMADTKDLEQFVQELRSKPSINVPPVLPEFTFKPANYKMINYDNIFSQDRLDQKESDLLLNYNLDQLKMVGYLHYESRDYVFIKTPYETLKLKLGDKIKNGEISLKYILIFLLINTYLGAITLQNVSNNVANQNQIVSFSFDAVSSAIPKLFVAGNDLIVDFKNISTLTNQNSYTFESGFVREVDLVTVGSRTRTVIVGGAKYKYQINQNANLINISFTNSVGQSSIGRENVGLIGLPKKSASNYNTQINDIKFTRDDNGGGVVEIPYTGDSKIDVKEERLGENLKLTLNAVGFNSSIIKRIDTTDFDTPIKYIDTKSGNNKLFLTIVTVNRIR